MTEIAHALYGIGAILVIGVIVAYVKRNSKLSAEIKAEFDKLHLAAENMMDHLHLIHQVASAPTAVAFVPAQPAPPAAVVPVAPAPAPETPPATPAPTVTDILFPGHGGGEAAPPAAAPAPVAAPPAASSPYPVNPGTVDFSSDAGKNFALMGVTSVSFVVPDGWAGVVLMNTIEAVNPATTKYPYTTAVNGSNERTKTTLASNNYNLRFGGPVQGDWEIALPNGVVTLGIQQDASSAVIFGFHASPAA